MPPRGITIGIRQKKRVFTKLLAPVIPTQVLRKKGDPSDIKSATVSSSNIPVVANLQIAVICINVLNAKNQHMGKIHVKKTKLIISNYFY